MAGEPGERRGAHGSTGEGAQPGPPPLPPTHTPGGSTRRGRRAAVVVAPRGAGCSPGSAGCYRGVGWQHGVCGAWRCYGAGSCTRGCAEFGDFWGVASHLEVLRAWLFGEMRCTRRSTEHGFFLGGGIAPRAVQSMVGFRGVAPHPELYRPQHFLGVASQPQATQSMAEFASGLHCPPSCSRRFFGGVPSLPELHRAWCGGELQRTPSRTPNPAGTLRGHRGGGALNPEPCRSCKRGRSIPAQPLGAWD